MFVGNERSKICKPRRGDICRPYGALINLNSADYKDAAPRALAHLTPRRELAARCRQNPQAGRLRYSHFALRNRAGSYKHSSMVEHQPIKLKDPVQIRRRPAYQATNKNTSFHSRSAALLYAAANGLYAVPPK